MKSRWAVWGRYGFLSGALRVSPSRCLSVAPVGALACMLELPRPLLPGFGGQEFDPVPAFPLGSVHAQVGFVQKI